MNEIIKNFGKIKNTYNSILVESISNKNDNKNLFKNYIKLIKNNEILKEQFLIYTNIENKIESDRFKATEYVKESINLLNKYSKLDIADANAKLVTHILYEFDVDYDKNELHEAITTLIFTDKNAKSLDKIMESTDVVVNYILNNKPKEINEDLNVPNSLLLSLSVDKFNDEYDDISESEKKVIQAVLTNDISEREVMFKEFIQECLTSVDGKLIEEGDITIKEKLLNVKDKLMKFNFNNDTYQNDMSKLLVLKNSLI